jgi:metal-dependent HD superfamily phosphatase/phosphodiesterase
MSSSNLITIAEVRSDAEISTFIVAANAQLRALGYTEHGQRHAFLVGQVAEDILRQLGNDGREAELAHIAGYLHDMGNVIHRGAHALSGALLSQQALTRLGMPPGEVAVVMGAIGNHEEEHGVPVSPVAAAVILADKADVHRSRVQNPEPDTFDIHDRVNYAATASKVIVRSEDGVIALVLAIDTEVAQVMDYFEIFLTRMVMMREAARALGCDYQLIINDVRLS